ncbi:hypothetical protein [Gaoshiqia sp. Z1-71]|uniref:hypothetical protein n=1 Tax=Gaoshiqia hydrogeniformans TaxID=3290090 RepID=UPI003BF7BA44
MKYKHILTFLLAIFAFVGSEAQEGQLKVFGKISYLTAQNIYVRFDGTNNIQEGDTVFVERDGAVKPLLIIESKSSLSAMGKPLSSISLTIGDEIFAKRQATEENKSGSEIAGMDKKQGEEQEVRPAPEDKAITAFREKIRGRVSASSYSSFSGATESSSHRMRYTFSLQASNIDDSRFSADTYLTFTHQANDWAVVQGNLFSALKIYSLALRYQPGEMSSIWLGRKINPNLSNVGAIDGIQYETGNKSVRVGAAVGFRPDYLDYSLNTDLFEFGAYLAFVHSNENGTGRSSVAFFEQKNNGYTDRRFVYFQHSNALMKNLFWFFSGELDMYKLENDESKSTLSLTSFYASVRYRFARQLVLFASYDARKNVIYYETFKNLADQLFEEAMRQGVHFRVNYRPVNRINSGLNASYRVRKNDPDPTKTLYGFVSFSEFPWTGASMTFSGNLVQTAFLEGKIYGAQLYQDLLSGKLYASAGYRYVDYNFLSSVSTLVQHIGELDLTWQMGKKLSLSANYEATFEKSGRYNRIYINLTKRF